jgi:hypothetical protein
MIIRVKKGQGTVWYNGKKYDYESGEVTVDDETGNGLVKGGVAEDPTTAKAEPEEVSNRAPSVTIKRTQRKKKRSK